MHSDNRRQKNHKLKNIDIYINFISFNLGFILLNTFISHQIVNIFDAMLP